MSKTKRPKIRVHRQLVPAELRLEQILEVNPPDFKPIPDLFLHLIHLTVEIPARRKDKLRQDGFVPFDSTILQNLHRSYRQHLDYLVNNGILEEDPHYSPDQHYCKSFRLNTNLYNEGMMWAELTDEKIIDKLSDRFDVAPKLARNYAHLEKYYFDEGFTIDEAAAVQHSYSAYLKDKALGSRNALRKHHMRLLKIEYFKAGWRWFTCDGVDHRLHTNVTNMDKGLRHYLTYHGQRIVAVDVKNSQPFLSIQVLRLVYSNFSSYYLKTPTYTKTIVNNTTTLYTPMLVKEAETHVPIDVYRYIQLVVNGDLYPYLIQEFEKAYGAGYFGNNAEYNEKKGALKSQLFGVMYANDRAPMKGKKLFKKLFPGVLKAFMWHKAGDHARLPISLQQLEADLVLNGVCARWAKEHPEIPLWPIHDALATTEGNEGLVARAIREVFKEETGFEPQLGFELWCNDCAPLKHAA